MASDRAEALLSERDRNALFEAVYLLDHVDSPIFHAVARMITDLIGELDA